MTEEINILKLIDNLVSIRKDVDDEEFKKELSYLAYETQRKLMQRLKDITFTKKNDVMNKLGEDLE